MWFQSLLFFLENRWNFQEMFSYEQRIDFWWIPSKDRDFLSYSLLFFFLESFGEIGCDLLYSWP